MKEGLYHQLIDVEDRHWWHLGRRELVKGLLKDVSFLPEDRALDVGCGIGANVAFLQQFCRDAIGLDYSPVALELATQKWPRQQFVKGDANHLKDTFEPDTFALVTFFNVLYHDWIKSDQEVLNQVYRIVRPGGHVLLTEPAFNILKRRHDAKGMGSRRYRLWQMERMLTNSGFRVKALSYFNSFSFLPLLLIVFLEKFFKPEREAKDERVSELIIPGPFVTSLCLTAFRIEQGIMRLFGKVPFGATLICLAQKPTS